MSRLSKAYIPFKGYYSSPFCRWQGSLANENPIVLGATTANRWFKKRKIDPTVIDYLYYGVTIAQHHLFYSHTWAAGMVVEGAKDVPALMVHQACTTSATCIYLAAQNIELGAYQTGYALMSDRCSNGPHTIWPNPLGPGGEVESENWLMDNFNRDPWAGFKMIQTAENVAKKIGTTKEECDAVTLKRYQQYMDSLANDRAFQKRYMFPAEVKAGKKGTKLVEEDEGVTPTTAEGLAKLAPVEPGGVHSFGSQTHPADGNCGFIVTTREKARELSADPKVEIQIVSYGFSRVQQRLYGGSPCPRLRDGASERRNHGQGSQSREDPQPLCGQRYLYEPDDGDRCLRDEQLWKLHDLWPPPGSNCRKAHRGIDRRACDAWWRIWSMGRLCRRGYGSGNGV